jgi:hypothetical protein
MIRGCLSRTLVSRQFGHLPDLYLISKVLNCLRILGGHRAPRAQARQPPILRISPSDTFTVAGIVVSRSIHAFMSGASLR